MGTLFSTLDIARSGLQVAQLQLDIVGHNIANVNKPGFSRQRVELISRVPINRQFGQIGRGVGVGRIIRFRDTFLDDVFRRQLPRLGSAVVFAEFFGRIEDVFLEPGPSGLSNRLNIFFDSLQEFSTNVESLPVRQGVVTEAEALAALMNETANRLATLRTNANEEIVSIVPEVNSLAERIAALNFQIQRTEVGGNPANDLRDARGVLLDELAKLVNIFTRERSDGQIDVVVDGNVLVNGNIAEQIEAIADPSLDPERNDLVRLQFVGTGAAFTVSEGELFAAFEMRDTILLDIDARMDQLASTIIQQINLIHSQASGIANLSGTTTSSFAVTDPALALGAAGLPFALTTPGSFDINVFDAAGNPVGGTPVTIAVGAGTTLNDIAAALSAVPNITATVTVDNTLEITGGAGFTYSFSNDTSGMLAALGVNVLFTGFDARSMGVNQAIINDPRLLASGFSTDPLNTGDNTAALAMAAVQNGLFLSGNSATINDFYEATVVQVGIDTRANLATLEIEATFVLSFEQRRQAISGVSLDEEATMLIQFQRAFEASARVITVADRMLGTLLTMAL